MLSERSNNNNKSFKTHELFFFYLIGASDLHGQNLPSPNCMPGFSGHVYIYIVAGNKQIDKVGYRFGLVFRVVEEKMDVGKSTIYNTFSMCD